MVPNIYDKNIVQIISAMNRNKMTKSKPAAQWVIILPSIQTSNLKTFITGRRISHPDACTSVEHAHPSYYIYICVCVCTQGTSEVPQIESSLSQYFRPQILLTSMYIVSSLWAEPTNTIVNALQNVKILLRCKIIFACLYRLFTCLKITPSPTSWVSKASIMYRLGRVKTMEICAIYELRRIN